MYQHRRRQKSVADGFDPRYEEMERQLEADPAKFDKVYGAKGQILVGMNQRARDAGEKRAK